MGKIGDLWVKIRLKVDEYKKGLVQAQQSTKNFTEWVQKNWLKVTGAIAGAVAAVRGLSSAIGIIADFEKANSVLAGVLGKTVDEIKALSDSAEMLGRSTAFTATEVTNLQTELAKLGFGEGQIMSMQKAVLNFATAMGVDLAEAAAFTGASLRTFGLRASDAEDMLNVLAVAADKSALGFSNLNTAMPIVGPVAKSIGFDIRDTATLLGVLANSGFDASSAATALRNIFLYLADSSSKLTQAIGKPVKTLPDLLDGLDKLKSQGISVGEALELTDKRAVAAFSTLIDGTASARELRSALDDVNGAVDAKAQAQIDNVTGSITLLKSAWDGFILGMKNSKGVIKGILDTLTKALDKASMLFRGTRVQGYQKMYADAATEVYKGGGREEAEAFMQKQLKAKQDEITKYKLLSEDTGPYWSTPQSRKASRNLKAAQEQLEGMKAAYAAVADQIANDAVAEAVNAAGDGGTETAEEFLKGFMEGLSKDKAQDAFAEFRAAVADEAEAIRSDMEDYDWSGLLGDFELENFDKLNKKVSTFKDYSQRAFGEAAKAVHEYQESLAATGDASAELEENTIDIGSAMANAMSSAIENSMDVLVSALSGEDVSSADLAQALLQPLADAAKQMGELLVSIGIGMIAAKQAIKNPYTAIAAGAALIALSAAMTSGLKAITSSMGSSSAMSSGGSSAGTPETSTINTEMTIYVKGKISGRDILISGEKSKKYYDR